MFVIGFGFVLVLVVLLTCCFLRFVVCWCIWLVFTFNGVSGLVLVAAYDWRVVLL